MSRDYQNEVLVLFPDAYCSQAKPGGLWRVWCGNDRMLGAGETPVMAWQSAANGLEPRRAVGREVK